MPTQTSAASRIRGIKGNRSNLFSVLFFNIKNKLSSDKKGRSTIFSILRERCSALFRTSYIQQLPQERVAALRNNRCGLKTITIANQYKHLQRLRISCQQFSLHPLTLKRYTHCHLRQAPHLVGACATKNKRLYGSYSGRNNQWKHMT